MKPKLAGLAICSGIALKGGHPVRRTAKEVSNAVMRGDKLPRLIGPWYHREGEMMLRNTRDSLPNLTDVRGRVAFLHRRNRTNIGDYARYRCRHVS